MTHPRILMFDLETAPYQAYTWGLHDVNIGVEQIVTDGYILMWSAKWLGEKEIMWDAVYKHAKPAQYSTIGEREITKSIWKLVDEADIVVTHNGDSFDLKHLNQAFLIHGLPPVSSVKSVDTLKEARYIGYFISKKLAYLTQKFKLGAKIDTGGFGLWKQVMSGDKGAWKKMVTYCIHDTRLEEKVYLLLRPFMRHHPNLSVYLGENTCDGCRGTSFRQKGFAYTATGKFHRYICKKCGKNRRGTENLLEPALRKTIGRAA